MPPQFQALPSVVKSWFGVSSGAPDAKSLVNVGERSEMTKACVISVTSPLRVPKGKEGNNVRLCRRSSSKATHAMLAETGTLIIGLQTGGDPSV